MIRTWRTLGWLASLLLCAGVVDAGTINLAWDSSSGAQGYEVHYGLAPGSYSQVVDTGVATTAALGGLTNGQTYYFAALAYNEMGDSDYSNEVSAVPSDPPPPDTIPPTTAISSPANGSIVPRNSNVTISASASDNVGVTRVEFYVNGVLTCPADTSSPYSCVWHVPGPKNKPYALQSKAFDAAGNMGQSAVVNVTSSN